MQISYVSTSVAVAALVGVFAYSLYAFSDNGFIHKSGYYHKYHVSTQIDWTVEPEKTQVDSPIFKEVGSGMVELDMIFEPGNPKPVEQNGYSYLKSYAWPDAPCPITIPAELTANPNKYSVRFLEASLDNNVLTLQSLGFKNPSSITLTVACPWASQSIEDPDLYKRFLEPLYRSEGFAFDLDGQITRRTEKFENVDFGYWFTANLTFIITDLGEYSEEELKTMDEL